MDAALRPPRSADDIDVDIVVDNFNYGRFVGEAVESALAQTHAHVNVIVVDDGSTDGSRRILRRYADRVELVFKQNGGQASALNAGLARCRGDVVVFLDADDMLHPAAVSRVAEVFAARPDTVHVPYRLQVVDALGRANGAVKPPLDVQFPRGDIAAAQLTFPFDIVSVGTSGNAFSVAALRRVAPIPEDEFAECADWYLVHVVPLLGRVTPIDEILGNYRIHGGNAYEPQGIALELEHVRQTVRYAAVTAQALERVAGELGLIPPFGPALSMSDVANRLISLRLDRDAHPRPDDTTPRLLRDGLRVARRRWDSSWWMKAVYVVWFLLAALAPRPVLKRLALVFLFRERRRFANRLYRRMHPRPLQVDVVLDRQA
jgi:glycosyltransferase involved in cell wall biosynthesis